MKRLVALADRLTARSLACRLGFHGRCAEVVHRNPIAYVCYCHCPHHVELLAAKEAAR